MAATVDEQNVGHGSSRVLLLDLRLALCRTEFVLHCRQCGFDLRLAGHLLEFGGDRVLAHAHRVLEGSGCHQFVNGTGPRLHFGGLVFGALDGHADVAELVGDTGEGLVDLGGRFGSRVGRLDGFFARPERLDLGLQLLLYLKRC